ncbi:hypothetical protein F4776DRAFT_668073 [Hypoxylon sp. NC0597]|nr:hypothetical protein F4776DRAFT_668073 [Hypoxylon sp. NC0597]
MDLLNNAVDFIGCAVNVLNNLDNTAKENKPPIPFNIIVVIVVILLYEYYDKDMGEYHMHCCCIFSKPATTRLYYPSHSTVNGCRVIGSSSTVETTTTTTTLGSQPTLYCKFGDCHGSNCPAEKGLFERRPRRLSEPSPNTWAGPENYGGNNQDFMAGEVATAYDNADSHNIGVRLGTGTTSSYILFAGVARSIAISGLHGCSSLIVVSKRGAWVNHMWETPSFSPDPSIIPPPTKEMQLAIFQQTVIAAIHRGHNEDNLFGLAEMVSEDSKPEEPISNLMSPDADPHIFLFTPYVRETVPSMPNYNNEFPTGLPLAYDFPMGENMPASFVGLIYLSILLIFGADVSFEVVPYAPRVDGDDRKDRDFESHRGKALVQYQPAKDCSGVASWRVWFEGHELQPSHQASWKPLGELQVSINPDNTQVIQNSFYNSSDISSKDGDVCSLSPSSSSSPSNSTQESSSSTILSASSPASSTPTSPPSSLTLESSTPS